jgi:HipA-like C-terminal domain
MNTPDIDLETALRATLARLGVADSAQLQVALGRSQPTLSRALAALAGDLVVIGAGRRTRYGLPQPIHGLPARQPLHWVHEDGRVERWGDLSFLGGGRVHVAAAGIDSLSPGALPWLLAPLRGEGFIGRQLAQQLAAHGLDRDPGRWPIEHQLFAALHAHDSPGALVLGEPVQPALPVLHGPQDFDRLADDAGRNRPAGSSAGGEQAKFLAQRADGQPLLVKFSPPRGTPFGERWHDLLQAEALALTLLGAHGVAVAQTEIVKTRRRSYLVSTRFDRIGARGRRHVVPLHAVHDAFVAGPRQHWAASAETLVAQRRLAPEAVAQVHALRHFGLLIGNTDMHFGNLSLQVAPADAARGRFTLAPLYDMLPMRWRPDVSSGDLGLLPFTPEPISLQSPARALAETFWSRLAGDRELSADFRALAVAMRARVGAGAA